MTTGWISIDSYAQSVSHMPTETLIRTQIQVRKSVKVEFRPSATSEGEVAMYDAMLNKLGK